MSDFAARLETLLKSSNRTQKEISERLKIAPSTLNSWIKGTREPNIFHIKAIAEIFDISTDWLIGNSQEQEKDAKKEQLIKNYELLNDDGQEDLLRFSEMLTSDSRKLKKGAETNHALSG